MMRATLTTISNAEFYDTLREDSEDGKTNWTVSRHVLPHNRILLYVCAPVAAIVATALAETYPQIEDDPTSPWFHHYMVDIYDLRMLKEPITREALRLKFPDWGYWKQPRNSVRVPEIYLSDIERFLTA